MSGKFMGFSQDEINKIAIKDFKNALKNPRTHHQQTMNKRQSTIGAAAVVNNLPVPVATRTTNLTGGGGGGPQIKSMEQNNNNNRPVPSKLETVTKKDESNITLNSTIDSLQDAIHFKPLPNKKTSPSNAINDDQLQLSSMNITSTAKKENDNQKDDQDDDERQISPESSENSKNSPFKGVSLKDFESQRRMIQEQNKEKKEMLYKAIEQHSERTAAEAKKLQEIKIELQKLDSELAADVAILRKQIELASIEFMTAQQNYHKIETQFLKAKIDLHQACEKKELLTEHLCTIISHNEDRKAKKLTELMEKVGLSSTSSTSTSSDKQ